jgi:Subtilase family
MNPKHLVPGCAVVLGLVVPGLFVGQDLPAERSRLISLNSVAIDTLAPAPVPDELSYRPRAGEATEVVLVKFPGPVSAAQLSALEAAAVRVYTYLPHDTFLVRVPLGQAASFRAAVGATWAGSYHPYYKISRWVADVQAEPVDGKLRSLVVQLYPDADLDAVVGEVRALGIEDVAGSRENPFFSRIRLILEDKEVVRVRDDLARLPDVFWIDFEPRRALLNDTTVWVGQSGLSGGQATPVFAHGIYGEGQTIAIVDTGIDADMCWFRDTTLGLPPVNACNGGIVTNPAQRKVIAADFLWSNECSGGITSTEWDTQDHGSHVAGTVAGDNFATPLLHDTADGMAPGAKLVIQDGGYQVDVCADLPGIGCAVVDLNPIFQQAYDQGARLHTNSWGDKEDAAIQNDYSAGSQDVDEFMWNHKDFLIFFAAGNSGNIASSNIVSSPSTAKSAVSVGATQRSTNAFSMASFSSCGPTDDGRIKPEVTVPGSSIISANADNNTATNNCNTKSTSGTSMATPGAAGLTALIRQYYMDGWYPSGLANALDGFTPSAALLRATLVNSGQNMTGTTAMPANCQGWGRVLLDNALSFAPEARKLFARDDGSFASGSTNEVRTFPLTVTSSAEPLKVTLAWTDFPSTPAANPHLNNDLDLTLTGPAGTVLGNVFSGGVSAAGGTADRRNTLEQVLLAAPATGAYTVTVRSFNVPNGPQPFALVATGALSVNLAPLADAGTDQIVATHAAAILNGSASSDPDGGPSPLTYLWTQIGGLAVKIFNDNQPQASFVPDFPGFYLFQLAVSDGATTTTAQVSMEARRFKPR